VPPGGEDDTVILPRGRRLTAPPPAPPRPSPQAERCRPAWPWLTLAALVVAGGVAWVWPRPAAPPVVGPPPAQRAEPAASPAPAPAPAPAQAPAPAPAPAPASEAATPRPPAPRLATATEAEILASQTPDLAIRRFAGNPLVIVLDFPTLGEQARMFNRVAALVEKAGLPRDRVLDDAGLDAAIRAGGGAAETFYYGHNYRSADLARFFALADAAGIALNAEEERLRELLRALDWLRPDAAGALVSLPHAGVEPWLDGRARAAMLRHELSHGEFFTRPDYAALVWRFWREMLSAEERERLRTLLAQAAYDPGIEEVMANEAHAFLFHTPDDRFFDPASAGFAPERIAALRAAFMAGMPEGWLRAAMTR
jgi:hypothetical protein